MTKVVLPWIVDVYVPLLNRHVSAKIDTGAENSSLYLPDHVADTLYVVKTVRIKNGNGVREGVKQVEIPVTLPAPLGMRLIRINIADRKHLKHEMILGRSALQDILVDASCTD